MSQMLSTYVHGETDELDIIHMKVMIVRTPMREEGRELLIGVRSVVRGSRRPLVFRTSGLFFSP